MEEHLKSLGTDAVITEKTSGSHNMASILEVRVDNSNKIVTTIGDTCIQSNQWSLLAGEIWAKPKNTLNVCTVVSNSMHPQP